MVFCDVWLVLLEGDTMCLGMVVVLACDVEMERAMMPYNLLSWMVCPVGVGSKGGCVVVFVHLAHVHDVVCWFIVSSVVLFRWNQFLQALQRTDPFVFLLHVILWVHVLDGPGLLTTSPASVMRRGMIAVRLVYMWTSDKCGAHDSTPSAKIYIFTLGSVLVRGVNAMISNNINLGGQEDACAHCISKLMLK